ncbi:MAG: C25 family cysteine peptidase, partial [bacterium]
MKKIISLLVLVYLPLVAGTVTRTVTFAREDLIFSKVNEYDVIELKGYPAMVEPGAPRLPRVVEPLLIPAGAVPTSVEVLVEDWVDLPGVYNIYPSQPDRPLSVPEGVYGSFYEPDPEVYSMATEYPGFGVRLAGAGNMNGYRIAHIELFPVQYIPDDGVLRLATRIIYRVEYLEHQVSDVVATERQLEVFGQAVRAHVVNPEDIVYCAPRVVGSGFGLSMVPPGYYEYVVVSESPIDTVFQRLVDWKTKKGVPGTVVLMSWINSNYSGYDLAEKLRNFIIDARDNWGTIYVLLGGSGDYNSSGQNIVPTRKGWYTNAGGPDNDYLPADLYYSDLDGDWDFDGDHTYGELADSVDMYADVYVGRASVYNVAMAQNFVYKVFTYEKNPPTDYIERLMLPTAILWSSYEERPMQDSIARMAPSGWRIAKMYERNGTLSRQGMIDTMNVGYNLGHWEGHGNENGIYMGGPYLTSSDADGLVNGDRVGIANSIACMCGGWDLMSSGGDCFAEHLVNRVGGGLAVAMMNARYGWGAYVGGYVPGPSERIDTTFYAKLFTEQMHVLGQIHHAAKDAWVYYADSGYQYDMTRWCIYELNLFGDPEMPIWTDEPIVLTVNYPSVIPMGNQNVNIIVTSQGSPVNNALVCLQKGTEVYVSDYTDASGLVTLSVAPTSPGQMYITATAQNHYPFEDSLMVVATTYAYVTYLNCSISDPTPGGNNNGQLNPGESVEIPLWVKNWGQNQGDNITGTLSSTDTYVVLSDTIKNFGNIPANDSAYTGADGYNLDISPTCPNCHSMLFTLTCNDDVDSTWVSQFNLMVYAPILTYVDVSVVNDNNGNGYLDPGETADLIVTIENEGGAAAENITSTLTTTSSDIT